MEKTNQAGSGPAKRTCEPVSSADTNAQLSVAVGSALVHREKSTWVIFLNSCSREDQNHLHASWMSGWWALSNESAHWPEYHSDHISCEHIKASKWSSVVRELHVRSSTLHIRHLPRVFPAELVIRWIPQVVWTSLHLKLHRYVFSYCGCVRSFFARTFWCSFWSFQLGYCPTKTVFNTCWQVVMSQFGYLGSSAWTQLRCWIDGTQSSATKRKILVVPVLCKVLNHILHPPVPPLISNFVLSGENSMVECKHDKIPLVTRSCLHGGLKCFESKWVTY